MSTTNIEAALKWLRGALDCKDWSWDSDRHIAAEVCLSAAKHELEKIKSQKAGPRAALTVAERMLTQDNRVTSNPIFIVERKHRVYGIDTQWGEEVVWLYDGLEVTDEKEIERLEAEFQEEGTEPDDYTRTSFHDTWEFVTACFTKAGCEEFIRRDGHNHGETRIYVASGYRNEEWKAVRKYLMSLAVRG